jgi:hypothetical protein
VCHLFAHSCGDSIPVILGETRATQEASEGILPVVIAHRSERHERLSDALTGR